MFIFIVGKMGQRDERVSDMRDRFFNNRLSPSANSFSWPDRRKSAYRKAGENNGENNSDKGKRDAN